MSYSAPWKTFANFSWHHCFEFADDFNFIAKCIKGSNIKDVVEIGAGGGRFSHLWELLPVHVTAVENDPEMFSLLQRSCYPQKNITPMLVDAFNIPLDNGSIDLIASAYNTLVEIRPICFVLGECSRLLKEDATLIFVQDNPLSVEMRSTGILSRTWGEQEYSWKVKTFRLPEYFGCSQFQTIIEVRQNADCIHKHVMQTIPSFDWYRENLPRLGFTIVNCFGDTNYSAFDSESHEFFALQAKKCSHKKEIKGVDLEEFYDSYSSRYDALNTNPSVYSVPHWVESKVSGKKGKSLRILDVGCGTGLISETMKKTGILGEYFGMDFSEKMLDIARTKGIFRGLLKWDLDYSLPILEHEYFDLVTICGVLEFVERTPVLLKEISQLLNPVDGEVWFTLERTSDDSPTRGVAEAATGWKRWHWTQEEAHQLCVDAGLEIISIEEQFAYTTLKTKRDVYYLLIGATR